MFIGVNFIANPVFLTSRPFSIFADLFVRQKTWKSLIYLNLIVILINETWKWGLLRCRSLENLFTHKSGQYSVHAAIQ